MSCIFSNNENIFSFQDNLPSYVLCIYCTKDLQKLKVQSGESIYIHKAFDATSHKECYYHMAESVICRDSYHGLSEG